MEYNSILQGVEFELAHRGLLEGGKNEDVILKTANVFRKLVEPHNGVLNNNVSISKDFEDFVDKHGYGVESDFSVKLASKLEEVYPDFFEGKLSKYINAKEQKLEFQNLPSEGVTAIDSGDYLNDSTEGEAENKSNAERAQRGYADMKKEKNTPRMTGYTPTASAIDESRKFLKGYRNLTSRVSSHLVIAGSVLARDGIKTRAHRSVKKSLHELSELLPLLAEKNIAIYKNVKALTSKKNVLAAKDKKEKEESAIADVTEAVDMLLSTVDEARQIEEALSNIKNLAEEALPEGGVADKVEDLFGVEDETPEELGKDDEVEDVEDVDELGDEFEDIEELADEEEIPELNADAPLDELEPNKAADFSNLNLVMSGAKKIKRAMDSLNNLFSKEATAPFFPKEQRAFDDTVTDMPNEDTFNDVTLKSQDQRANIGRKDIDKELSDPGFIHDPGRIQDVRASIALGKTANDTAIVITSKGVPIMKATYANVAGGNVDDPDNFLRFLSAAYVNKVAEEVTKHGLEAVKNEMFGTYIKSARVRGLWVKKLESSSNAKINQLVKSVKSGIKKSAAKTTEKSLDEKKYYAEAFGDSAFAAGMVNNYGADKEASTELENLKRENSELKRKKALKMRVENAAGLTSTVSNRFDIPMTQSEFNAMAKLMVGLDDTGFKAVSNIIEKIAERVEPSQKGIMGNSLEGVEDGRGGSYSKVSDQDGMESDLTNGVKEPQKNITPPKTASTPSISGVIPQMTRSASNYSLSNLDKLGASFTCTRNRLKNNAGMSDSEIQKLEYKHGIHH